MCTLNEYVNGLRDVYESIPKKDLRDTECQLILPEFLFRKLMADYDTRSQFISPQEMFLKVLDTQTYILNALRRDSSQINSKQTPLMELVFAWMWKYRHLDISLQEILDLRRYVQTRESGLSDWESEEDSDRQLVSAFMFTPYETLRLRLSVVYGYAFCYLPKPRARSAWIRLAVINWSAISYENGPAYRNALRILLEFDEAISHANSAEDPDMVASCYTTLDEDLDRTFRQFIIQTTGFFD